MFKRTDTVDRRKTQRSCRDDHPNQTIQGTAGKVHEAPGVQPVFLGREQVIDYATCRACFRSCEIRVLDSNSALTRIIAFSETESKIVTFHLSDGLIKDLE